MSTLEEGNISNNQVPKRTGIFEKISTIKEFKQTTLFPSTKSLNEITSTLDGNVESKKKETSKKNKNVGQTKLNFSNPPPKTNPEKPKASQKSSSGQEPKKRKLPSNTSTSTTSNPEPPEKKKIVEKQVQATNSTPTTNPSYNVVPKFNWKPIFRHNPANLGDKRKPIEILIQEANAPPILPPKQEGALGTPIIKSGSLQGIGFLITGTLVYYTRAKIEELIKQHGGIIFRNTVGSTVKYVIYGENPNREKMQMAKYRPDVKCVDEREFVQVLEQYKPTAQNTLWTPLQTSNGELFTSRFKPTSSKDILGNRKCIDEIGEWIKNWGNRKGRSEKKALLLHGPPGIGKSTAVTLLAIENGRDSVMERNASDSRNKSSLESLHETVVSTGVQETGILIMDEVDGMSSGDRGGVAELIKIIKESKIPIICICNDRWAPSLKSLVNHCKIVQFYPPTQDVILKKLQTICKECKMEIDPSTLGKIIEYHHRDVRRILNFLQMATYSNTPILYEDLPTILSRVDNPSIGPFEVLAKLVKVGSRPTSYRDLEDLYHVDNLLIPEFVFENYISIKSKKLVGTSVRQSTSQSRDVQLIQYETSENESYCEIDLISKAADSISMANTIDTFTHDWALTDVHGFFSTIYPTHWIKGVDIMKTEFPASLGKLSTYRKNVSIYDKLKYSINTVPQTSDCYKISASLETCEEYGRSITSIIAAHLFKLDYDSVVRLMELYGISKSLLDSISNITEKWKPTKYSNLPPYIIQAFAKRVKTLRGRDEEDMESIKYQKISGNVEEDGRETDTSPEAVDRLSDD
jgi:replication factor C subunit 1